MTARAIRAVGDMGPEDDPYPDGPPVKLDRAVTLIPADRWRLVPGGPSQRVIQEAIVADVDGYLSLHGQRGLWLYHGLWHVRFADELGGSPPCPAGARTPETPMRRPHGSSPPAPTTLTGPGGASPTTVTCTSPPSTPTHGPRPRITA